MTIGIGELYGDNKLEGFETNLMFQTHVALPCIVQTFYPEKQTVDVQPAIREKMLTPDNVVQYIQYPLLVDVPVAYPQGGGFSITFPISKGDECLVVFSDLAIDNWWKDGNVQNPIEQRRHDLSDGIAIFGLKSQVNMATDLVQNALKIDSGNGQSILVNKSQIVIKNKNARVAIRPSSIIFTIEGFGTITASEIFNHIRNVYPNHTHEVMVEGMLYTTSKPGGYD